MEKLVAEGEQEREEFREDCDREFEKLKREALVRLFRQLGLSDLRIEFLCGHICAGFGLTLLQSQAEAEAQADAQADERVKRLIAKAEAKCEKRWASEISQLQRNIARQVSEACRRTRYETERQMGETLVAADRAVLAASGVCELRRRGGPRLRLTSTDFESTRGPTRVSRNRMDRSAV